MTVPLLSNAASDHGGHLSAETIRDTLIINIGLHMCDPLHVNISPIHHAGNVAFDQT